MKFLHLNEVDTCSTVAAGRLGEKADEAICFRKWTWASGWVDSENIFLKEQVGKVYQEVKEHS